MTVVSIYSGRIANSIYRNYEFMQTHAQTYNRNDFVFIYVFSVGCKHGNAANEKNS